MVDRRPAYHAEVTRIRDLTPRMRRLTLAAPELAHLQPSGPDEYLGLLMPQYDGHDYALPAQRAQPNIRAAVAALPAGRRPDLRWYTLRDQRRDRCEIDVDVVLHGDAGPGSRFASAARVGSRLGLVDGTSLFVPPRAGAVVVVGDETALPAIARILEDAGPDLRVHVVIETESATDRLPLPACASITWVHRGDDLPGSALHAAVRAAEIPQNVAAAWVCGEQSAVADARRHLVRDREVPPDRIVFSGYWRLGRPRG